MSDVVIVPMDTITAELRREIVGPLEKFNVERGFAWQPQRLVLALRQGEKIVGGLIGDTGFDWLHIEMLSVCESLRRHGHGRRLIAQAEAVARERRCIGAWLDTLSFQAPGFYQRLGYRVFGTLPNYPGDQTRIFLEKRF